MAAARGILIGMVIGALLWAIALHLLGLFS
jgi:hypothetical protein